MTYGNQQSVQLTINSSGTKVWALYYLPPGYDPSKKYPCAFFLHGVGEVGQTENDLKILCKTALPQLIAGGMQPRATDKAGNAKDFIVISPQASSWPGHNDANELSYMIPDAQSKFSIDPSLIFVTGLSAGGCGAWQCTTNDAVAKMIAGIVPLSPAGFDATNSAKIAKANNLAVWSACGDADGTVSYDYAKMFVDNLVAVGLPARFTTMKGQGHSEGAWNPPFQLDFGSNPNNSYLETIWTWMLNNPKTNTVSTPTTTTTTKAPVPTIPAKIRAESYTAMLGIQTEATSDVGGGKNVGYIDAGDWMEYKINVPSFAVYTMEFRVSSPFAFGQFDIFVNGVRDSSINVPNTGGWQNWVTVSRFVTLQQGVQTIKLYAVSGSWNINLIEFKASATTTTQATTTTAAPTTSTTTQAADPLVNANLSKEIASVLNKYSIDSYLNRSDWSLADYIILSLRAVKNLK